MSEPDETIDREQAAHDMGVANDAGERAGRLHHREPHDDMTPHTEPEDDSSGQDDEDDQEPAHGLPREPRPR